MAKTRGRDVGMEAEGCGPTGALATLSPKQHPAPEAKALLWSSNPALGPAQLLHPRPCTWGWPCWSPSAGTMPSQVCPL